MNGNKHYKRMEAQIKKRFGSDMAGKMISDAEVRLAEICAENPGEPKKLQTHTVNKIYPSIALFDSMLKNGVGREEAAELLNGWCLERAQPVGDTIKRVMKIPGLYRLVPGFFAKMTSSVFGEAAGFKAEWIRKDSREMQFNMLVCPYREKCVKYGCPEIVRGFCESDDVCYGSMHPKLIWGRTKTLGLGGDCCDFKMTRM